MYIERAPNRHSPSAVLLRESYREGKKVINRTLANLSALSEEVIEGLKVLLRGGVAVASIDDAFVIDRSLPHGHVAAVLGSARACGAERWWDAAPEHLRKVLMGLLVARVIAPASKRATQRMLHTDTVTSSVGPLLGVGDVAIEEISAALDWLGTVQPRIEKRLARKHLTGRRSSSTTSPPHG